MQKNQQQTHISNDKILVAMMLIKRMDGIEQVVQIFHMHQVLVELVLWLIHFLVCLSNNSYTSRELFDMTFHSYLCPYHPTLFRHVLKMKTQLFCLSVLEEEECKGLSYSV
jgi:hypothetical protein